MSMINAKFTELNKLNADQARELLEQLRWPEGPVCPRCGHDKAYSLKPKPGSKHPVRKGIYKCKGCRQQFSVTVGTIFEGSHIPLNTWLVAISLMCSSKKGISAHQLHRMLGITYKSAWFMAHRIRYALEQAPLKDKLSGIIEVDETYVGGKSKGKRGRGAKKKTPVVSLVQRDGVVKSRSIHRLTAKNLKSYIRDNVDKSSVVMTDDFKSYGGLGKEFSRHEIIQHSTKEYVRGNVHTNTAEGYFSLLKRGINGVYQHVSKHHLQRYLHEFDFRYNMRKIDDEKRTTAAISCIEGKRLMYRDSSKVGP